MVAGGGAAGSCMVRPAAPEPVPCSQGWSSQETMQVWSEGLGFGSEGYQGGAKGCRLGVQGTGNARGL